MRPSAGKRLLNGLKTALSFKASCDTGGTWTFGLDLTESAGGGGADTGMLETDPGNSSNPYLLQQFGQETWNEATGPDITYSDARVGAARGRAALDNGFFRARWDRATRAEQRYLRAMAVDGDALSSSGRRGRATRAVCQQFRAGAGKPHCQGAHICARTWGRRLHGSRDG